MTVFVLGRFPPPIDGQTIATERLANLLDSYKSIVRIDTEPSLENPQGPLSRAAHFLRLRPRLKRALARDPLGTVLWTSISPDPLGHLRDFTISAAAMSPTQLKFAVIHRGNFRKLFESTVTATTAVRLADRLDGFVFLTHRLSEECKDWIAPEKRVVIPNTIDDAVMFSDDEVQTKQRRRRESVRLRILFVGHMLESKGYLDALEATGSLHESGIDVQSNFVGRWSSSAQRDEFYDRISARGLENIVVHHGAVNSRAEIRELYQETDVFLLPTYYPNEAQPLVILEALNAGIPVVSTRHAGIPEVIRSGKEGYLVSPKSIEEIVDAVKKLSDVETWLQLSSHARQRFLDVYSPEAVRSKWIELLRGQRRA